MGSFVNNLFGGGTPPAPDYAGAAQAQGAANVEAARTQFSLNNPDEYGPDGSRVWTPLGGDRYRVDTTLSPAQQALKNSQDRISQNYANTAEAGLGRVSQALATPFDQSRLAAMTNSISPGRVNQSVYDNSGQLKTSFGPSDFSADAQKVRDATLARYNQFAAGDEESLRQRLANQGITPGSEAYNREFQTLTNQRNDARTQAILAGSQEQSRLFGLAQQQAQFNNQALGQQYNQGLQTAQFGNQGAAQQFNQNQQAAQFGNQSRQQGIQEQAYLRQLPLNETNALRTGSQVSGPQFQNYYTGAGVQAAPIYQAASDQGAANAAANANSQSGFNGLLGAGAQLGAAYLTGGGSVAAGLLKPSDPRLKEDVKHIGVSPGGYNLYDWKWKGSDKRDQGVMATELFALRPDAVKQSKDGYLMVDYDKVN